MLAQTITHDHPWPYKTAQEVAARTWWARSLKGMARTAAAVSRWHRARRDTRQLLAYDDRLLQDIGVARGGIERAVRTGRA
jgi:uncharacterized protein YjiS (DUF1127 family)